MKYPKFRPLWKESDNFRFLLEGLNKIVCDNVEPKKIINILNRSSSTVYDKIKKHNFNKDELLQIVKGLTKNIH